MKKLWFQLVKAAVVLALASPVPAAYEVPAQAADAGGAYFDTGRALLDQGRAAEGFKLMMAAVTVAPENIAYQTYLLSYLDRAEFSWSVALLEDLHAVAPEYPPVLQRLAKLYEGKQRHDEAEALYLKWADLRPDQPEPYARLGEHYYFTGQYDKGLKAFARHRKLVGESDYAQRRMAAIEAEMSVPTVPPGLFARVRTPSGDPTREVARAEPGTHTR